MDNNFKHISLPTISTLIVHAITMTEQIEPKQNKKQYALNIIKEIIDTLPESDNKNFLIDSYQNNNISDSIDLIIDASKGKLDINKMTAKRILNKIFKIILSCIKIKSKKSPI